MLDRFDGEDQPGLVAPGGREVERLEAGAREERADPLRARNHRAASRKAETEA